VGIDSRFGFAVGALRLRLVACGRVFGGVFGSHGHLENACIAERDACRLTLWSGGVDVA
jgi:hypothetical protein